MVKKTVSLESGKYKLNTKDGKKILKGLGLAVGGAAVTFAIELLPQVEWGQYAYLVIPLVSVGLNTALKLIKGRK